MSHILQTIKASTVEAWREYWRPFLWLLPISWQSKIKVKDEEGAKEFSRPIWWLISTTLFSATLAGACLYLFAAYVSSEILVESPWRIFVLVAFFAMLRIAFYLLILARRR